MLYCAKADVRICIVHYRNKARRVFVAAIPGNKLDRPEAQERIWITCDIGLACSLAEHGHSDIAQCFQSIGDNSGGSPFAAKSGDEARDGAGIGKLFESFPRERSD